MFGKFGANALGGEAEGDAFQIDFLTETIKCSLHTNSYSPAVDSNEVFADATNELTTANGYTAGGFTLASKTAVYNATGNITTYDCGDISWTASGAGLTFQYAVFWRDGTSDPLIGYIDCGAQSIAAGNTFTIATGASGLFTVSAT